MAEPGASQILNRHATVGRRFSYERAVNELLAGTDIKINGPRPWDIRVHDERFFHRILGQGTLGAGESYMDGWWDCEQLDEMLTRILSHDIDENLRSPRAVLLAITARLINMQSQRRAFRVGKQHYDLGDDLYERMLDPRMIYTCGYWENMHSLDAAQEAKLDLVARKIGLKRGMRVLDIGCGWGGLALELARTFDVEVLGISLSKEQVSVANQRAEAAGLNDRVKFQLIDFRDVRGSYDRVVSIAMFEAVGVPNFGRYFRDIRRLLTDDGVALVHSIGRRTPPSTTSPWTRKYIFPGGYIPALSETLASIEKTPFWVTDIEILRLHYAETLRHWRLRFWAEREAIAKVYDERFCRMWEYYLAGAEMAFRYGDQMIFQIQLAKQRTALPITRDYMVEDERARPGSAFAHARAAE